KQARPRATFSGEWSPASSADRPGCAAVETWLSEVCSPHQPAPIRYAPAVTPAAYMTSDAEHDVSGITTRALPWTEYDSDALPALLEAYKRTFGTDEKLPYKLLYDADLVLTRALHIEDNIAVPTSLLLDKHGVIRWSYVAEDYADRPSAQQILNEIGRLPK